MKCPICNKQLEPQTYHPKCMDDPIPYEPVHYAENAYKPKVYSVDLDNTLSVGSAWTCDECETLEPRQDAIDKINELYEHNFIVIHTARRHGLYGSTIKWLERNGVRYHALRFEKMPCDIIFDLDAINKVEDL